jgi:hypothetical protein
MSILDQMRMLHAIHSFDIIVGYRSVKPNRISRFAPFLMKFALFILINSSKSLAGIDFPSVTFDQNVMYDFIYIYWFIEIIWNSRLLDYITKTLKGDFNLLSRIQVCFRIIHSVFFTLFRLITGYRVLQMFSGVYWQCVVACVLFLEFNGWLLKYIKGGSRAGAYTSTLLQSCVGSSLAAWDMRMYPVLAMLLLHRHFLRDFYAISRSALN